MPLFQIALSQIHPYASYNRFTYLGRKHTDDARPCSNYKLELKISISQISIYRFYSESPARAQLPPI